MLTAATTAGTISARLQGYQEVPLTLVLGLTTTASALHGMLSWDVTDRCMQTQHFKLVGGCRGAGVACWVAGRVGDWVGFVPGCTSWRFALAALVRPQIVANLQRKPTLPALHWRAAPGCRACRPAR